MKKRNATSSQVEYDGEVLQIVESAESIQRDIVSILQDYKKISINDTEDSKSFSTEKLSLLRDLQRLIILVDLLEEKFPEVHKELGCKESFSEEVTYARNEILKWSYSHININDHIDIFTPGKSAGWYEVKVLEVFRNSNNQIQSLKVHYLKWRGYDETIPMFKNKFLVAPVNTFSKKRITPKRKKKKSLDDEMELGCSTVQDIHDNSEGFLVDGPEQGSDRNSSDRLSLEKAIKSDDGEPSNSKIVSAGDEQNEIDGSISASTPLPARRKCRQQPSTSTDGQFQRTKKVKDKDKDNNEWVCSICEFLEAPDDSDLLLCDGPCLRSFHIGCLHGRNLSSEPNAEESWLCLDCTEGKHNCFICEEKGDDFKDVFKCSQSICGKFYHLKCLQEDNLQISRIVHAIREVDVVVHSVSKSAGVVDQSWEAEKDATVVRKETPTHVRWMQKKRLNLPSVRCPYHYCDTCYPIYHNNDNGSGRELSRCSFCPRAFHPNCIPPGSRFNPYCVICPRHPFELMPSKEVKARKLLRTDTKGSNYGAPAGQIKVEDASNGANKDECSSAELMTKVLINFWDQISVPEIAPNPAIVRDYHFKLQMHIKETVENTPQQWKLISKNDYDSLTKERVPPVHDHDICCDCTDFCGDRCMNRILRFECSSGKSKQSQTCKVGAHCSNRALQDKRYAEVEVFREPNMGWGLKAKEFVASGTLVIEYVGEIIDYAEVTRRMSAQCSERPNDKDFYIMELDTDLYVDGKYKGNCSRYINHSCDPNCELQRWVVGGAMRIGIYAVRDIEEGESLSYDYQFDTNEADTFRCHCGTEACRGTMAPKKKNAQKIDRTLLLQLADSNNFGQLSKAEREQLILAGKIHEKKISVEGMKAEEWRRSYTGRLIPGEAINEIKNGPVKSSLNLGRHYGRFLVRNVHKGSNMLGRYEKLTTKKTDESAAVAEEADRLDIV